MRNWLIKIIDKSIANEQNEMIDIRKEREEWRSIHDSATNEMLSQEAMNQYVKRLKMIKQKSRRVKNLNKIRVLLED